jgi:hypothetical protein
MFNKGLIKSLAFLVINMMLSATYAMDVPIYDFSIKNYNQQVDGWLSPNSQDYTTALLSPEYQYQQLHQFYNHYYSTDAQGLSPWSQAMVEAILPLVKKIELDMVADFNNQNKPFSQQHFGENFKEHDELWLNKIKQRMNLSQFDVLSFTSKNRAIVTANTFARALPEAAPDFFHASLPGQGFPFDNLQESALWVGTPLYILMTSTDKAWSLG